MLLINVGAFLAREKYIIEGTVTSKIEDLEVLGTGTDYVILSHRWRNEVDYKEMANLAKLAKKEQDEVRGRDGYHKILKSCEQAKKDGFDWIWIDTCCINKENSSDVSEAINSMYSWCENSKRCYSYLHDVDGSVFPTEHDQWRYNTSTGWPEWFSRGWTLQELIAPREVQFFNQHWKPIGNKRNLTSILEKITHIPSVILSEGIITHGRPSVAQIMSWAANREVTRVEDRAYSLLGLFGVRLAILYGEGNSAFRRLQLEILRVYDDHSIFAWGHSRSTERTGSVLADDPSVFSDCSEIVKMEPDEYIKSLGIEPSTDINAAQHDPLFSPSIITNLGITICLPLTAGHGSPSVFEASLACRLAYGKEPLSIHLASFKSRYYRYFGDFEVIETSTLRYQRICLVDEISHQKAFKFKVDSNALAHDGFSIPPRVLPDEITLEDNSITLSDVNNLAILVYNNSTTNTFFSLAVGYSFDQDWANVVCDEPAEQTSSLLDDYTLQVLARMQKASPENACQMAEAYQQYGVHLAKHVHLPRTIQGIQVVYDPLEQSNGCLITIGIVKCAGCCAPSAWRPLNDVNVPRYPHRYGTPEPGDDGTRKEFLRIREHFYTLLDSVPDENTDFAVDVHSRKEKEAAAKFFVSIFGEGSFKDYIGDVALFTALSTIVNTEDNDSTHMNRRKDKPSLKNSPSPLKASYTDASDLSLISESPRGTLHSFIELLADTLIGKMSIRPDGSIDWELWLAQQMETRDQAKELVLKSFGSELLRILATTYQNSLKHYHMFRKKGHDKKRISMSCLVEEINAHRKKHTISQDDDEKRTLEEDITGKILLTLLCALERILSEVVGHILNDKVVDDTVTWSQAWHLKQIGKIFANVATNVLGDGRSRFPRIVADARAGISKHQLLLTERATQKDQGTLIETVVLETRGRTLPISKSPSLRPDILSWTNQDPRESQLFNSWGVIYRFSTVVNPNGASTTTLWRTIRTNKEDRVAKLEWGPNGGLGRAVIGKNVMPMADLLRPERGLPDVRTFNAPDGLLYRWRPSPTTHENLLEDSAGHVVALFRHTRPTRYQIGDVYGELHLFRSAGAATITHPPILDTVTVTAMLYRFSQAFGL